MPKKTDEVYSDPKSATGYELIDPLTSVVVFEGVVYKVEGGLLVCPPEVAPKLVEAGFLKG